MDEFFKHEHQAYPPSISDFGKLRSSIKSELFTCFDTRVPPLSECTARTVVILDGAAVVQKMKPMEADTFEQYALDVFIPYIMSIFQTAERVDIVWNTYRTDCLKSSTCEKCGKDMRQRVSPSTAIPKNWQNFLRVDGNKRELFHYRSQCCISWVIAANKEIVATDGEQVLLSPDRDEISSLSPCLHEEADTRMFVHAADAANSGHNKITIRSVDTDVVVLAISVYSNW